MKARPAPLFCALMLGATLVACAARTPSGVSGGVLPAVPQAETQTSPIEHVVIVIQENRSFDNFFATFRGADGTRTGGVAKMPALIASACAQDGQRVVTQATSIPLTEVTLLGKGFPGNFGANLDLDHIHSGFTTDYDRGKMDGFDKTGFGPNGGTQPTCTYTYQYVNPADIKPYWDLAEQYVLADHTFQTQGSGSFTAHQDLIAGGTDLSKREALIDNPTGFPWGCDARTPNPSASPPVPGSVTAIIKKGSDKVYPYGGPYPCLGYATLRDLLDRKGVSWKFYAMAVQKWNGSDGGETAGVWSAYDAIRAVRYGTEWQNNVTRTNLRFFTDVTKHQLPEVSWITPDAVNSDHPFEPSDTGPSWIASIVNAIGKSSYWKSTAIVVVWDDWGGYYDHVAPPRPRNWEGGPGFRVPMLIISPYVKPHVDHTVYEFGSILRFIEENWKLGSLGTNDADSTSIGNAFDFHLSPRKFKRIDAKYPATYFLHQSPSGVPSDTQ